MTATARKKKTARKKTPAKRKAPASIGAALGQGFTLCSLNMNGIRAAEKHGFSRWLAKHRPDLLCLQEVRARHDQVENLLCGRVDPVGILEDH